VLRPRVRIPAAVDSAPCHFLFSGKTVSCTDLVDAGCGKDLL
jgi:hypothetical protein